MTQRAAHGHWRLAQKESGMAPQHTPVITGTASRDAAIGLGSCWISAVAASPLPRLTGAEKSLVCNELRCLSKDRPPPPRALYGERSGCNDQPQRSGYVQVARVDSSPGRWWVWSEFLLRARRCSEADRRQEANLYRPCSQGGTTRVSPSRQEPPTQRSRHLMGPAPTATDTGYPRLGSRPATLTRGRKQ
jgi:hypothetical protein